MKDKYYVEIKELLVNNEITNRIKDYSKNKSDLETYYKVGKELSEAGKHYGEGIIKKYSIKLTKELGKGYTETNLKYYRQFYSFLKSHTLCDKLTWSHYRVLLSISNKNEIEYYISICIHHHLSVRQLQVKIKSKEYERLPESTKTKLISNQKTTMQELIPEPIIIRSNLNDKENISEKVLHKLILENIESFMKDLGIGYTFVGSEYKIKIGDKYNYLDFLLFNYIYNCFVIVELKVTPLKKEHIGQIEVYMNYIDEFIKSIYHDKTIGVILVKRNNEFIIEYVSDKRIISRKYVIQ